MPDHQPNCHPDDLLAIQALLYAGDALPPEEAQVFEQLLSQNHQAREVLGLAVQAAYTAEPDNDVLPDPAGSSGQPATDQRANREYLVARGF